MEIEIKIPLADSEYDKFLDEAKYCSEHYVKFDEYYSIYDTPEERKSSKEPLVRIRDLGGNHQLLTVKRKSINNSIEVNEEIEAEFKKKDNQNALLELLEISGYKKWFSKKKDSYLWYFYDKDLSIKLTVELVCVNDKYKYFEIEVADYDGDKTNAITALKNCCNKYNLDYEKRDEREWTKIVN